MELIRDRIASRRYPPSTRLPRETELAAELGVSRAALREAIRALELIGVLDSRHGSGTYVSDLSPESLLRGLGYSNALMRVESAAELAEFRRITEPEASALAASRATAEQVATIQELLDQMETITDPREYARLDAGFHQAILDASGNSLLAAVGRALTSAEAWRSMWAAVTRDVIPPRTRMEHRYLVQAIAVGDSDLARSVAHAHVSEAQRRIAATTANAGAPATATTDGARTTARPVASAISCHSDQD
jgi:GntR family transcriptional repressor for pyruvate dehydrogenase complex